VRLETEALARALRVAIAGLKTEIRHVDGDLAARLDEVLTELADAERGRAP
jgi:hypothetical protein